MVVERYDVAFKAWMKYFYETEVYDRSVCAGFNEHTKEAIPLNYSENSLIQKNAIKLRRQVDETLRDIGIDTEMSQTARLDAARYSFDSLKQYLIYE